MNQEYTNFQNEIHERKTPVSVGKARWNVGLIAFSVVLIYLLAAVVQILAYEYFSANAPAVIENDWFWMAYATLPLYCAMPIAYLLLRLLPAHAPQKQKHHPLMWLGFLSLFFALSYFFSYLGQIFGAWFYEFTNLEVENEVAQMTSVMPLGANILFVGILGPIFEELFYRKVIVDRLRRYGDLPAILISGLIFSLVHGNLDQIFYTLAGGMLLGFVYVYTGNVLYTISIHVAFNMIGGVYATEITRRMGGDITLSEDDITGTIMVLTYGAFIVLTLVVGTIFYLFNAKRFHRSLQKGEHTLRFDDWMNAIFVNPGMWIFLAMIAFLIVFSFIT